MRFWGLLLIVFALAGCQNAGVGEWLQLGKNVASEAGFDSQVKAVDAVQDIAGAAGNAASVFMGKEGSYDIPLPDKVAALEPTLAKLGLGGLTDQLKQRMNQAASEAAGEATPYFKEAAKHLTITDAVGLVMGGDTAVTEYFRGATEQQLTDKMQPVVQDKLKSTGFYDQYQTFLSAYNKIPFIEKPNLDIEGYVVDKTMDGLYNRMAEEELTIRQDPQKAGSAIVSKILSAKGTG